MHRFLKLSDCVGGSSVLVLLFIAVACSAVRQAPSGAGAGADELTTVIKLIIKVNDHWQKTHTPEVRAFWDHAAYQTGNMAAYQVTGLQRYRDYATRWAAYNNWQGAGSKDTSAWKYDYGESSDHVLFGDWQACFQTYMDLYQLDAVKEERKIARVKEVMGYQITTPNRDYWWWADGLYMVMPVMTKLYQITRDRRYLEKLYDYFLYADSVMYDPQEGLYYRDARYVFAKHQTPSGRKDFWSRGDGWVFAALAKVLETLPQDAPHRDLYLSRFQRMATAVVRTQQQQGYWCRSLLDSSFAPGPETSGTAFFVYGMQKGLNAGWLEGDHYQQVANKGWTFLITYALQPDGSIGYIQPIGERAVAGQVVNRASTADFGVGAFLLAATERYKRLLKLKGDKSE